MYEIFLGNACKIFSSPDGGEEQDVEDDEGGAGRQVDHHHAEPDTSTCHDIFSCKYLHFLHLELSVTKHSRYASTLKIIF